MIKYYKIRRVLNEMKKHREKVVRNTYETIKTLNIPFYIIGKDVSEHKPLLLEDDSMCFYADAFQLSKYAGATYAKEIFIADWWLWDVPTPDNVVNCIVSEGYQKDFSPKDRLYSIIVHETNHVLNRRNIVGSPIVTYKNFFDKMNTMDPAKRVLTTAKDEFHAYKAAQGNILGMSDDDIKRTIERNLGITVDWSAISVDWNTTNEI